jgi:uncharacterized protein YcbK (DUF882 family)
MFREVISWHYICNYRCNKYHGKCDIKDMDFNYIDRRSIIKLGLAGIVSVIFSGEADAFKRIVIPHKEILHADVVLPRERRICIHNLHTKEDIETVYYRDGEYIDGELKDLDFIFRDHYNGLVKHIDPGLLDFLVAIQQKLQTREPFQLISGYRSKRTNERLRRHNKGVAKRSMHIFGKAADIRLPSVGVRKLRRAAYELQSGGVGYYPRSNFVHVDVGKVRFWRG